MGQGGAITIAIADLGTSPKSADTDGDLLTDGFELYAVMRAIRRGKEITINIFIKVRRPCFREIIQISDFSDICPQVPTRWVLSLQLQSVSLVA